ncbi:MAG: hypothetical protein IKX71_08075 [Bacteroidales bacterium]|nr:hypothetical protein [Bacteroidales bacterium]
MKKVYKVLIIATVSVLALVVVLGILVVYALFGPDKSDFGRTHPIPEGIEYSVPYPERTQSEVAVDIDDPASWLQIWDGLQGGIYLYDFYYTPLPAGEIFLRCYEVNDNIPLSESRLKKASTVIIGATASFLQLVNHQQFSIYEGVWGEYYAARIEVWFKNAETSQESKLLEKVYRVEGWQR